MNDNKWSYQFGKLCWYNAQPPMKYHGYALGTHVMTAVDYVLGTEPYVRAVTCPLNYQYI